MSFVYDRAYLVLHGIFFCLSKKSSMYMSYGPQKFLPGPARCLGDFNLRQPTIMTLIQPLYGHLTWFLQVNKFLYLLDKAAAYSKVKKNYFDQIIVQNQSWTICQSDLAKKIRNKHVVRIFFENLLSDYYSACKYLQLLCFKVMFWRNIFILFSSRQLLVKKRIVLVWSLS